MNIQCVIRKFGTLQHFEDHKDSFSLKELYEVINETLGLPIKKGRQYNKGETQWLKFFLLNWGQDWPESLKMKAPTSSILDRWLLNGDGIFWWRKEFAQEFISMILEFSTKESESEEYLNPEDLYYIDEETQEKYIDISFAALLANKSKTTIRNWIKKGHIEARREEPTDEMSQWLIKSKSLLDYIGDDVMLNPFDLRPVDFSTFSDDAFYGTSGLDFPKRPSFIPYDEPEYDDEPESMTNERSYGIEKSLSDLIKEFMENFDRKDHHHIVKFEKQSSTFVVAIKLTK